tara:strand:+ start:63 stop:368 length:306 start_codon:yes stop_codon:yes gene_type:complete
MTLTTALKIIKMTSKALAKKYGSQAMGVSKKIKAKSVIEKAKKGGRLLTNNKTGKKFNFAKTSPKQLKKEQKAMQSFRLKDRARRDARISVQRDIDDVRYG